MREIISAARDISRLTGRTRPLRWWALALLAAGVALIEALGAAAVLLLVTTSVPDAAGPLPVLGPAADWLAAATGRGPQFVAGTLVLTIFTVRAVAVVARAYVEEGVAATVSADVADRLVAGYLAAPIRFHASVSSAELVRNAFTSATDLGQRAIRPLTIVFADSLLLVAVAAVAVSVDPVSAAIAGGALLATALAIQKLIRPHLRRWGVRLQQTRAGTLTFLQQALVGIRDIRLLGSEQHFRLGHDQQRRRLARTTQLQKTASAAPGVLVELALVMMMLTLLAATTLRSGSSADALPTVGLFAYVGFRLQQPAQKILNAVNELRFSRPLLDDLTADLERIAPFTQAPGAGAPVDWQATPVIQLRSAQVEHPVEGGSVTALHPTDLTIASGEFIGVCGPTGGGKSTLLDLMTGLIDPDLGTVEIAGEPAEHVRRDWWGNIGVVSQDPFLIEGTIRDNITLGAPSKQIDQVRLEQAVDAAQLSDVVRQLPKGLDTEIGEGGARLSGGQRQRIAIARALYRNPKVLILDEATSALDRATEEDVMRAVRSVPGRTVIAVAHRLDTLRDADRILLVAGGAVDDDGTYQELLLRSELFRSLASPADASGPNSL